MSTLTIHQPEHLSYLGFFEKVSRCDILVLLDNVDFEKNYFQNRNRIYTHNGIEYISVPIVSKKDKIKNTLIDTKNWNVIRKKNLTKIELAYKSTPYFEKYYPNFRKAYTYNTDHIAILNIKLLYFILSSLNIHPQIYLASELNVNGSKSELLANICTHFNAKTYISGTSGRDYLDKYYFENIKIDFQDFKHPVYTQFGKTKFEPFMSVIDALFNVGDSIMPIIKAAKKAK